MRAKTSKSRDSQSSTEVVLRAYPVNYTARRGRPRKSNLPTLPPCPECETLCVMFSAVVGPDNQYARGAVESTLQSLAKRWTEEFGISVINYSTTLYKGPPQTKLKRPSATGTPPIPVAQPSWPQSMMRSILARHRKIGSDT